MGVHILRAKKTMYAQSILIKGHNVFPSSLKESCLKDLPFSEDSMFNLRALLEISARLS